MAAADLEVAGGAARAPGRLGTAAWWLTAALAVAGLGLTVAARGHLTSTGDLASNLGEALAGIYYATLGALVVRRAGNLIGWLLAGEGIALTAEAAASAYALQGLGTGLPGAELVGLLGEWLFVPVIAIFLLFPDGRLPSRRWATPYQVLSDFAGHLAGQLEVDAALSRMAALLGGAAGATRVRVWVGRLGAAAGERGLAGGAAAAQRAADGGAAGHHRRPDRVPAAAGAGAG